jgi:hypothetical protein
VELFDNYSKFYFFRSIWEKHLLPGESFYLFKNAFIQINQISKNTFKWSKEIATHGKVSLLIAKKMLSMMQIVSIGTKAEKNRMWLQTLHKVIWEFLHQKQQGNLETLEDLCVFIIIVL